MLIAGTGGTGLVGLALGFARDEIQLVKLAWLWRRADTRRCESRFRPGWSGGMASESVMGLTVKMCEERARPAIY